MVQSRRARLFDQTGRLAEAESAFVQAADLRERVKDEMPTLFPGQQPPTPIGGRQTWARSLVELGLFHLRHGHANDAARRCAQARDVYEDTAARFPGHAWALWGLARFLIVCPVESFRDPARALRLAEKAVARDENYEIVGTQAWVQFRVGNHRESLSLLELLPRLPDGQDDPDDRFFRAMARWRLGDKEAARRDYDEAVRLMPFELDHWEVEQFREEAAAVLGVK